MLTRIIIALLLFCSTTWADDDDTVVVGCPAISTCATVEDSCTTIDTAGTRGLGSASTNLWLAADFTVDSDYTVCAVDLRVDQVGSPAFNVNVYIYTNNAGSPGTQVGTGSGTFAASSLPSTPAYFTFTGLSAVLSAGQYWIVAKASAVGDGTNYIAITSETACDLGAGVKRSEDGLSWASITGAEGWRFNTYK